MKSQILSNSDIDFILSMEGASVTSIANRVGVSTRTIKRVLDGVITEGNDDVVGKLTRLNQKKADQLNAARKQVRETARMDNVVEEMTKELTNVIEERSFSIRNRTRVHPTAEGAVGVVHLSDLHVGERVVGVSGNAYDLGILSARLKKFANRVKQYFSSMGITTVLVASTGDLINSDRRKDECMANANNRSKIVFTAVDLIQQFLLDLNEEFNVSFSSVCGNESRVDKDVGWSDITASENYDLSIHQVLSIVFRNSNINVIPMNNPLEQVVNVNGKHFLLIHGHNKTANTNRSETEVAKIRGKYAALGVTVDYVIFGHVHCTYISDWFARGASTVGSNGYSDHALNLSSKASQNAYVVHSDGGIDAIKIDIQQYDINDCYAFDTSVEEYKPLSGSNTVTIQSVII